MTSKVQLSLARLLILSVCTLTFCAVTSAEPDPRPASVQSNDNVDSEGVTLTERGSSMSLRQMTPEQEHAAMMYSPEILSPMIRDLLNKYFDNLDQIVKHGRQKLQNQLAIFATRHNEDLVDFQSMLEKLRRKVREEEEKFEVDTNNKTLHIVLLDYLKTNTVNYFKELQNIAFKLEDGKYFIPMTTINAEFKAMDDFLKASLEKRTEKFRQRVLSFTTGGMPQFVYPEQS